MKRALSASKVKPIFCSCGVRQMDLGRRFTATEAANANCGLSEAGTRKEVPERLRNGGSLATAGSFCRALANARAALHNEGVLGACRLLETG